MNHIKDLGVGFESKFVFNTLISTVTLLKRLKYLVSYKDPPKNLQIFYNNLFAVNVTVFKIY